MSVPEKAQKSDRKVKTAKTKKRDGASKSKSQRRRSESAKRDEGYKSSRGAVLRKEFQEFRKGVEKSRASVP